MQKFIKLFLCSFILILLSGCSMVYINKESIDDITKILGTKTNLKTISVDGYSYYLPQGVNLKENNTLNSVLYYNGYKMYLYVDLVSYYHKVDNTYTENSSSYYSKKIDTKDKNGYLEINELDDKYFIEYVYNYCKLEGYVRKEDLNVVLTKMSYILNSVKYNDTVLESIIGDDLLNYNGETFNIFRANGNDNGDYIEIADEIEENRKDIKDEDRLEIIDNVE